MLVSLRYFFSTSPAPEYSSHWGMTCINHPSLDWSTKNPFSRNIFFSGNPFDGSECKCPFSDLRVRIEGPITEEQHIFEYNNDVVPCTNGCDYFHTLANGCPTQEMIDRNHEGYDGTYEDQDIV